MQSDIKDLIEKNRHSIIADFFTFLEFPSISSEPEFKQPLLDCADWLVKYLKKIDFEVELWPTSDHPVIFASNMDAGSDQPTLLIYNHYDVQPVDPLSEWISPPFEPTQREGEIYARGAQDNKGQCYYVIQALKLLMETDGKLPINIKLCIEGEEEIGSPGLSTLLETRQSELAADYLAIVDVGLRSPHQPSITIGTRGIVTMDIELHASETDLHSGSHGGIIINPIHALVQLLSNIRAPNGKITIPGFYDSVVEMSEGERSKIAFSFNESEYLQSVGAHPIGGEKDKTPLERAWTRPTFEINGISGGYTGKGFKTVIPSKAFAKVSCRLVPDQDPEKIGELISDYLQKNTPEGTSIALKIHSGHGKAVRTNPSSNIANAFSKAFEEVFKAPCEYILEGASIPIAPELTEASGAEMVLVGLGLPTDQIHAPNEHFGVDRIEKGIMIIARAIELLADKKAE